LDQAFIDAVMEWAIEVRLGVGVAAIAKLRLLGSKQAGFRLRVMRGVTPRATHVGFVMFGALEVGMAGAVAREAERAGCLGGRSLEDEYFGFVAAPLDVRGTRAMTRFATMPLPSGALRSFACKIGIPVLGFGDLLELVVVTAFAGV
jgi:hypothetical protein